MADRGAIVFKDLAQNPHAGITYRRVASERDALLEPFKEKEQVTFEDFLFIPAKSRGAPGVAILDFDLDGDDDIYVTNGPGAANSLYANQLVETGALRFVDVGAASGVGAADQDSAGVCYGDIDNDGDPDLYVLGSGDPSRMFENRGDGTFADITQRSGTGASHGYPNGCAFGDVDGDGLLDLAVGNTHTTWDNKLGTFANAFDFNVPNQLFRNVGHNVFEDVSDASGINDNLDVLPPGTAAPTWLVSLVDYDLDGDVDLFLADDQAAIPTTEFEGVDRGVIHILENDGHGRFTDVSEEVGIAITGSWMGFDFADFDCNGRLDFFSSNLGDYSEVFPRLARRPSRWFLQRADGTFADPGVGKLVATPFGWGVVAVDYDNDSDSDVIYHGGIDFGPFIDASNPGVVLRNPGCTALFEADEQALAGSTDHLRRNVEGVATGDLNRDGFPDVVSVSSFDFDESAPLVQYPGFGSPYDDTAFAMELFAPIVFPVPEDLTVKWNNVEQLDGTLSVEINSGGNGNHWLQLRTLGTVGITSRGRVNRDGVGAILTVRPHDPAATPAMQAVAAGTSLASQNSPNKLFGLGRALQATVEVLWPGGVRNRLYDVQAGERVQLPEIPCSFDDTSLSRDQYRQCVQRSLGELVHAGVLTREQAHRFSESALRAFGN